jgi:hypothetical protein
MTRIARETVPVKALKRTTAEGLLIWVYQRQKADVVMERGIGLNRIEKYIADFGVTPQHVVDHARRYGVKSVHAGGHTSEQINRSMTTDSAAMVANTLMGAGGYSGASYDLHPDAETVHEYVRRLRVDMRAMIVEHARTGLRPDWAEGERLRVVPILRGDGQPAVVWNKNGDAPLYCRVTTEGADIVGKRARYTHWWDALNEMAQTLMSESRLLSHEVVQVGCPRKPWKCP